MGAVEKKNFYFASVRAGGSPVVISNQSSRIVSVTRTGAGVYVVLLQEGLSASDYVFALAVEGAGAAGMGATLADTDQLNKTITILDPAGAPIDGVFSLTMFLA